jgi:predicted CXXCH cytochrome family protein
VTLETAQNSVTCTACHNPHSDAGFDHLLVKESYALCSDCHAQTEALSTIHHPAKEMFEGVTLVPEVAGVPGAHFTAEDGPRCQTCHMQTVSVSDGKQARVSHTLSVVLPGDVVDFEGLNDTCTVCHTEYLDGPGIQQLVDDVQTDVTTRLEAAQAALTSASPQWVSDALAFVDGDSSMGMHNYAYTQALLSASEKELGLAPMDTTGQAQILTTREVLDSTREAARSDTIIFGLTAPMLIALGAAALILLIGLFMLARRRRLFAVLSLIVAFALVAGVVILRQPATAVDITGDNANCLFCHAQASYSYTFADTSRLNLSVDHERMANSVHTTADGQPFGCLDCHSADIFPHQSVSFASRGAYRVEMSGVCINCHLDDTAHYEDVLEGNILVGCSDCHTSHYVVPADQLQAASVLLVPQP